MWYCTNCGHENEEEIRFCVNCGKSADPEAETHSETGTHVAVQKKPMPKKQKYAIIAGAALIGILLIAYVITASFLDPMKQIEAMDSAVKQGDHEAFMDEFKVPDKTIYDTEEFFKYIDSNGWGTIRDNLVAEINGLENDEFLDPVLDNSGTELINIIQKDLLFGLFQKVEFELVPIEVYVEAPFKGMEITIHEHTVTTDKEGSQSLGQYLPGVYEWSYAYQGEWAALKNGGELQIESYGSNQMEADLDWDMASLDLSSEIDEAIVYVDGTSTEKTVSELETIYPLPNDETIEVYAIAKDEAGKELKSNIVTSDSGYAYFTFESMQEQYLEKLDSIKSGLGDLTYSYWSDDEEEMLEAEEETYKRWDDALNEIYDVLEEQLPGDEMEDLKAEQQDWITEKETAAEDAASGEEEESMQDIVSYQTLSQYTKDRCYELVENYME